MDENKNNALTEEQLEEVSGGDIPTPTLDPGFNEPGVSEIANDGNCGNTVLVSGGKCQSSRAQVVLSDPCIGCKYHK